jgi:hypothetical protein
LGGDSDDEEVGQIEGVVSYDRVLQSSNYGDGRVERITEEEIAWSIVS